MNSAALPTIRTRENACCVCGAAEADIVARGRDFEYDTCANEFHYVQCRSCKHCYLDPQPEPSELATIYPSNYGNYSNSVNPGLAFRVKGWLERFTLSKLARPLPPHANVLDIEHVFQPVACVEKIHVALKPGGRVLFETPSTTCLDYSLFRRRYWGGYHFPRHLNLFEPGNFTRLLERRGFVIESLKHKVQPVHWIWTLHHFFKERGMPRAWTESFNLRNPFYLAIFSVVDGAQVLLLRRSSNMQIIARKKAS